MTGRIYCKNFAWFFFRLTRPWRGSSGAGCCQEREMACDEGVVLKTQAPRAYAACLTSLAERGLQRDSERRAEALSLAAWRRKPEPSPPRAQHFAAQSGAASRCTARALLAFVGCGLLLGSVELARCPQMVAFVAAPKPVAIVAKLVPGPVPDFDMPPSVSGFRAIPAKAILPSSALMPAASGDAPRDGREYGATRQSELHSNDQAAAGPRKQLIKATMPSASVATSEQELSQNSGGEYIVFTAWEQVETMQHQSREMADYDTGEAESQPSQPGQQPNAVSATQFTVTRLILSIDPAGQVASSKPARQQTIRN